MRSLTITAIAAFTAFPAFAQLPSPAPDAAVFQVLRPTDKDLTCEQLSVEANTLNASLMQQQAATAAAAEKSARGRALMGRLGGAALSLGGQAGMMNGMLSSPLGRGALSAANQMAASAGQATPQANAAPAMMSPQQQRMNMLLAAYQTKGC